VADQRADPAMAAPQDDGSADPLHIPTEM